MKIIIECKSLLNNNLTGVGIYIESLLYALEKRPDGIEIILFPGFSIKKKRYFKNIKDKFKNYNYYDLRISDKLCSLLRKLPYFYFDALLGKFNLAHFNDFTIVPLKKTKTILTVYDLSFLVSDKWHTRTQKKFLKQHIDSIRKADHIVAISENTKKDLINKLNISKNKISVIYPFTRNIIESEPSAPKIQKPFILYTGTIEPRKNIVTLIRSFINIEENIKKDYKLVIAGRAGWGKHRDFYNLVNNNESIIYLSYVTDSNLAYLYKNADFFVYPSYYEGFGLPVLEAMSFGLPVITSNTSSLPEVAGDAGICIDPYSEEDITKKISLLITNNELKKNLKEKSLNRSLFFNKKKMSENLVKLYKDLGENK